MSNVRKGTSIFLFFGIILVKKSYFFKLMIIDCKGFFLLLRKFKYNLNMNLQELTDAIYTFTKHNVFITDSMDILSRITENEIYKKYLY